MLIWYLGEMLSPRTLCAFSIPDEPEESLKAIGLVANQSHPLSLPVEYKSSQSRTTLMASGIGS